MTSFQPNANLLTTTVLTAPSPAASGTTLTVSAAWAAKIAALTLPVQLAVSPATTEPDDSNTEIVRCTAADGVTGILTLTRTQEGTSARTIIVGDRIRLAKTKFHLDAWETAINARIATGDAAGGDLTGTFPNPTIANAAVTDAKLRNSAGVSVIGRSANSVGAPTDIAAGADGRYLARAGGILVFQAISEADITATGTKFRGATADHTHASSGAQGGTVAHSALTGLTSGDDHTQYALLAGRGGGQNLALGLQTAPSYPLHVGGALTTLHAAQINPSSLNNGATTTQSLLNIAGTMNGSGTYPTALWVNPIIAPTTDPTNTFGISCQPTFSPPNAVSYTNVTGMLLGLNTGSTAGTIATALGVYIYTTYGSVKPTNATGLTVTDVGAAGITTAVGAQIATPTNATNNYSLVVTGAAKVGIGTATPATRLHVTGSVATSGCVTIDPTITTSTGSAASLALNPTFNGSGEDAAASIMLPTFTPSASVATAFGAGRYIPTFNPGAGVTITTAYGCQYAMVTGNGAGAVTNLEALFINAAFGTMKPTKMVGAHIADIGSAGITTAIGLQVDTPTAGTNKYVFAFSSVDGTAAGAYYGRIPVLYNSLLKYIHIFSA